MKILSILFAFLVSLQMCKPKEESKPIAQNVKIEFRLAKDNPTEGFDEKILDGQKIYLNPKVEITEKDISTAKKSMDEYGNYIISLDMNDFGAKKFENLTGNNVTEKLAILVNGEVIMAPIIQMKIPGGKVQITGNFTKEETDKLFNTLTNN